MDAMIEYRKVSGFPRGTLYELLSDAYAYEPGLKSRWAENWRESDAFFYDNPRIADKHGFITTKNGEAIGFLSWDPRNLPEYAEIGHNCIIAKHKGKGYGKMQLQEAVNRICQCAVGRIIVTTNESLLPARRMYESVGFKLHQRRENSKTAELVGDYFDYVYLV